MTANAWFMQRLADILGQRIEVALNPETTALGAAYHAGQAVGFFGDAEELEKAWGPARAFEPEMSETEREARYGGWLDAVARVRSHEGREGGPAFIGPSQDRHRLSLYCAGMPWMGQGGDAHDDGCNRFPTSRQCGFPSRQVSAGRGHLFRGRQGRQDVCDPLAARSRSNATARSSRPCRPGAFSGRWP